MLWPRWRLWTIDADRGIPAERRAVLCRATGIPTAAVHTASLEPIATRIAARRPKNDAAWPWILTLGRDRQHTSVSQYCPGCLEEDDPPHYRIGWRLAWRTSCARHGLTLADRCPSCGKAQQLHHLRADAQHVGGCAACGAELRHAKASPGHAGPASAVEFQQAADEVARTGRGRYFDADVEAGEWFAIADFFSSVIRRAVSNPTKGLTTALARAGVGWPLRLGATPGARIERLDVRTRQALLGGVQHVMRLGRDELHDALEAAGTSRQGLFGETRQVPTTLAALGPALPDHPKPHGHRLPRKRRGGPRPRHEVLKMMQRLENRLEHITT